MRALRGGRDANDQPPQDLGTRIRFAASRAPPREERTPVGRSLEPSSVETGEVEASFTAFRRRSAPNSLRVRLSLTGFHWHDADQPSRIMLELSCTGVQERSPSQVMPAPDSPKRGVQTDRSALVDSAVSARFRWLLLFLILGSDSPASLIRDSRTSGLVETDHDRKPPLTHASGYAERRVSTTGSQIWRRSQSSPTSDRRNQLMLPEAK
jgi:hypothetical protein